LTSLGGPRLDSPRGCRRRAGAAQPLTCGQTITQNTTLDADLNCPVGTGIRAALFIGADGITLDLGGHTISASRSIIDEGHDNVTIRNGRLDNDDGPLIQDASGTRLRNLRFEGISTGLALFDAHYTDIRASEFPGAALGIGEGSSFNTVARNRFSSAEGVVTLGGANHNRVVDNTFAGPPDGDPIVLNDADDNQVARNRMRSLFGGITLVLGSDRNTITDNVITAHVAVTNFSTGISLSDSSHNVLRRNATLGTWVGFQVNSGSGNRLARNLAAGTVRPAIEGDADGFRVQEEATGTVLASNRADGAADDGIDVEAPGTALRSNTANGNADLGIEAVPGIIDLGGNTASGNGNALQCLNIVCG
jgi:parallel beta-helix repeat protein